MTELAPITRLAGAFAAEASFDDLPDAAVETVRLGFTDVIAVLLAGIGEPVTEAVRRYAEAFGGKPEAPALLGQVRLPAEFAAMLDAVAAHAHDYDDYAYSNHPSAVLVPAILAAAALKPADGRRLATAYVVGYEIWGALMTREPDHLHTKGWHPTAVFGPVGAAAAAANILGLDAGDATMAIALAASHAGGVMSNFGSMTKPYHAGRAAEAGLRACRLVAAGMTARVDALEADTGLMAALSPSGQVDRTSDPEFGQRWLITKAGLNIKKYPTVGASQRCIDAILELRQTTDIPLKRIVSVRPRVSVKHAKVMPFDDPKRPAEAKFSLSFACAAALRFGQVTLAELRQDRLDDPQLRALMAKVAVDAVEDYDPDYPVATPWDVVRIDLDDGRTLETSKVRRASGHADNPLSVDGIWRKFQSCADDAGLPQSDARRVFDWCQHIERQTDLSGLLVFS